MTTDHKALFTNTYKMVNFFTQTCYAGRSGLAAKYCSNVVRSQDNIPLWALCLSVKDTAIYSPEHGSSSLLQYLGQLSLYVALRPKSQQYILFCYLVKKNIVLTK